MLVFYNLFSIQKRLESFLFLKTTMLLGKNNLILLKCLAQCVANTSNFKKKYLLSLYFFDLIFCYKGWRYFKHLPSNGQRTWTNSWTAAKLNSQVKNHKIFFLKNILGLSSSDNFSAMLLIEYYNLLWKLQWYDEWLELKKNKLITSSKRNFKKNIVVNEEAILSELLYIRGKFLKKKVRIQFKGAFSLLGFEPGLLWNYN